MTSSTPHARGSTVLPVLPHTKYSVYPACAGIHQKDPDNPEGNGSLPRMRGDPPELEPEWITPTPSTPHARGSTTSTCAALRSIWVYPACAGIHRCLTFHAGHDIRLPRMRGDPPLLVIQVCHAIQSTPHARGSTWQTITTPVTEAVYPACAGIHLFRMFTPP